MKKFLQNISLFVIIFLTFFVLLNLFQSKYNNEPAHYKLHYQEVLNQAVHANGIILGSSYATHGIQPSLLDTTGIRFFNFALNGAGPGFYLNWYQKLFSPNYPKPDYCIYVVNWFMFDKKSLERAFEHDAAYFPLSTLKNFIVNDDGLDHSLLIHCRLPALKYRSRIWYSLKLDQGDERFLMEKYNRGFVPYEIPFVPENFPEKLETPNILDNEVAAFEKLIEKIKSAKTQVVFVMTPECSIKASEFEKQTSLKLIDEIAKKHEIPFLNFNTELRGELNQNVDFYSDGGHFE